MRRIVDNIELHLPYPPTANLIWTRTKFGMRKSDKYVKWLGDVQILALQQKSGVIVGPYKMTIQAKRPDRRKRDIDNIIKPCSDAMMAVGAVSDDSLCEFVSARWVTQGEGVCVRLEPAAREDG